MQLLFDLLHNLSKDEKRLYNQYKRKGRFNAIHTEYLAHTTYNKQLDKQIYEQHFADVSKPFYSMQKRFLLDDIVTVLLSYSNLQNPHYNLMRAFAKGQLFLDRKNGDAALHYLTEAHQLAREGAEPFFKLSILRARKAAVCLSGTPSFAEYEALLEEEAAAMNALPGSFSLLDIKQALRLLRTNTDELSQEELLKKATHYKNLAEQLRPASPEEDTEFELLEIEGIYYELSGELIAYHKSLVNSFKQHEKTIQGDAYDGRYYRLLNMALQSGLKVGDFLLLSGLIYRTSKLLDTIPSPHRERFLPAYLETVALYHFHENDMPTALRMLEELLELKYIETERYVRCVYYRLAIMLAAHLAMQAKDELHKYREQMPELAQQPGFKILEVMIAADRHQNRNELALLVEGYKNNFRKAGIHKSYIDCLQMMQAWTEARPVRLRQARFFPEDWEEVLRVDLWLKAKLENQFYYNLLNEEWQQRRKVIN
jgi:hypothetical protein